MKNVFAVFTLAIALSIPGAALADHTPEHKAEQTKEHKQEMNHDHEHGKDCGHKAVKHGDHEDYEHEVAGQVHKHKKHDGHYDECEAPVKGKKGKTAKKKK